MQCNASYEGNSVRVVCYGASDIDSITYTINGGTESTGMKSIISVSSLESQFITHMVFHVFFMFFHVFRVFFMLFTCSFTQSKDLSLSLVRSG